MGLLVRRATQRDPEAFGALYEIYHTPIFHYIRRHVQSEGEAEDLAGRVFLNAWQAISRYQERGRPFSAWLYRLAHNATVDFHRTRRETLPLLPFGGPIAPLEPEEMLLRKASYWEVAVALGALTAAQRDVILLKFFFGLDNSQIAQRLGKREGAVRALQMRGLAALRQLLEKRRHTLSTLSAS